MKVTQKTSPYKSCMEICFASHTYYALYTSHASMSKYWKSATAKMFVASFEGLGSYVPLVSYLNYALGFLKVVLSKRFECIWTDFPFER